MLGKIILSMEKIFSKMSLCVDQSYSDSYEDYASYETNGNYPSNFTNYNSNQNQATQTNGK